MRWRLGEGDQRDRSDWRSCTRTSINSFLRCCFLRSRGYWVCPEGFRWEAQGSSDDAWGFNHTPWRNWKSWVDCRTWATQAVHGKLLSICSRSLRGQRGERDCSSIVFIYTELSPDLDKYNRFWISFESCRQVYETVCFGDERLVFSLSLTLTISLKHTHNSVHLEQHGDCVRFFDEIHPDTVGDARVGFEYERQGEEEEEQRENTKTVDTVRILVQGSHGVSSYCDASVSALSSIYSGQHSRAHTSHDEHVETSVPQTSHGTTAKILWVGSISIKSLSFQSLRGFDGVMRPYGKRFQLVVNLLKSCPSELNTQKGTSRRDKTHSCDRFSKRFLYSIDTLLMTSVHSFKKTTTPIPHSNTRYLLVRAQLIRRWDGILTLADLVHHMRANLTWNNSATLSFSSVVHSRSSLRTIQQHRASASESCGQYFHNKDPEKDKTDLWFEFCTLVNKADLKTASSLSQHTTQTLTHTQHRYIDNVEKRQTRWNEAKQTVRKGGQILKYEEETKTRTPIFLTVFCTTWSDTDHEREIEDIFQTDDILPSSTSTQVHPQVDHRHEER